MPDYCMTEHGSKYIGFGVLGTLVGPVIEWCRQGWLRGCTACAVSLTGPHAQKPLIQARHLLS